MIIVVFCILTFIEIASSAWRPIQIVRDMGDNKNAYDAYSLCSSLGGEPLDFTPIIIPWMYPSGCNQKLWAPITNYVGITQPAAYREQDAFCLPPWQKCYTYYCPQLNKGSPLSFTECDAERECFVCALSGGQWFGVPDGWVTVKRTVQTADILPAPPQTSPSPYVSWLFFSLCGVTLLTVTFNILYCCGIIGVNKKSVKYKKIIYETDVIKDDNTENEELI